jgi:hypothetical protein
MCLQAKPISHVAFVMEFNGVFHDTYILYKGAQSPSMEAIYSTCNTIQLEFVQKD